MPLKCPRLRPTALALALGLALPAFAQVAPDAGQTLRELQRDPPPPPPASATLRLPAETEPVADSGPRFTVRAVRVQGVTLLPPELAQAEVEGLAGRETSLGQLRQAARRIGALYRERGYLLARAYVPAQESRDGTITIQVLEGQLGKATVDNRSLLPASLAEGIVAAHNPAGAPVQAAGTDRALLLLADLPGAGAVTGTLSPGANVGASDLLVSIAEGRRVEGDLGLDNHGNRYTGQHRVSGRVAVNGPFGLGDRAELRATLSDRQLAFGRAAYDAAVGPDGLRLGAALSSSRYELAREFAALDATGSARSVDLHGSYPMLRSLPANVWVGGSFERRRLHDEVRAADSDTRKSAKVATVEVYGDASDAWLDGGYSSWRLGYSRGSLQIDSPIAAEVDNNGPRSAGDYGKWQLSARHLQALSPATRLSVSVAAQQATRNLDSSEKFVLGGAYGVRAYPQGEGSGDEGWQGSVEISQRVLPQLDASVFADGGHVKVSHTPHAASAGPGGQTLRGWGVGVAGSLDALSLRADLAWRSGGQATTAPDRKPRLWLQAGWRF